MLRLLTLALIVGVAAASCPNKCSGHGQCSTNDKCACYSNYQGSDCSMRTCPFGLAWADIPTGSTAHDYAECSNRGTCERSSGECECFEGFSGAACGRTTCPQDCSGHGTCETIEELAGTKYAGWDAGKSRGCKCDGGYSGVDCATRMCPKGDDPLTTEVDVTQASTTSLQVNEVQNVTVQAVSQPINSGNVTFTFTDLYNSVWTTRPVLLPPAKAYLNNQALLTGTCATGSSITTCDLVGAPTGDADDVINGLNIDVTISGAVQHRVITDYTKTQKIAKVDTITDPSDTGVYAVRGGMKTNAANWKAVAGRTIFIDATLAADGTYTGTLDAKIVGATVQTLFRKGDYLMVGNPLLGAATYKTSTCLMQLAADYVADATTLSFVADDASTPCVQGVTGAKTALYGLWDAFTADDIAYDGATKKATAYNAVTGALTIEAAGTAGKVLRFLVPGMWIRLYHNDDPAKAYCDMQVNSFDNRAGLPATGATSTLMNADVTSVYVNPASATATTLGGSNLCNDWSYAVNDRGTAKYLGATSDVGIAIIHSSLVSSAQAAVAVNVKNTGTTEVASADGVATITSSVDLAADIAFMGPGTLLYLMNDDEATAATAFYCACVISVAQTTGASGFVKCVAPPTIAGVAPTSCTTKTRADAAHIRFRIFAQNSLHFHEVDSNNPNRFQYHKVGDTFRVSNVDSTSVAVGTATSGRPTSSAEYEVSHMDPATASSAIFFKFGSKPNGGGMYPVLNVLQTATAAWSTTADIKVVAFSAANHPSPWLRSTIVIQPSRAGKAWAATSSADTWALSDVATVNSARDVKRVLEELPNQVIDSVDVAMTSNTVGLYAYSVTFTGGRNSGNQHEIAMNAAGCNTDGCQPRYTGVAIQRATFFDDLVIEAGKVTVGATPGAETALLNDAGYFSPRGSETMLFYQAGAMNGQTAPNMYATKTGTADPAGVIAESTTAVITDGTTTAVAESPTSVMILRNKGAHSDTDKSVYFKAATYEITRGTKESLECAGRGSCEEGLCSCYEGYTGEACATMTVLT